MPRCDGWCGACYEGIRGRATHPGHFGYRVPRPVFSDQVESVTMPEKRRAVSQGPAVAPPLPPNMTEMPLTWDRLTNPKYADGSPRKTDSLTLFYEEGALKLCLSDRDQGFVAFLTAQDPLDLLWRLEGKLTDGSLEWRPSQGGKRK